MHFDEILTSLGEFGRYQKRVYLLLCIPSTIVGFHMVLSVFLSGTPAHRCKIPGYDNDTYAVQSDYHQQLIDTYIPPSNDKTLLYDKCRLYDVTNDTYKCSHWVYDDSVFESTFTKEQNLVCDDAIKNSHAQMIFFGGVLVGAIGLGALSDIFGRKKTLYLSFILLLASTLGLAWAPNFAAFAGLRFVVGFSCAGIFMTAFVIGMELVGPSKRVWAGVVVEYFFALGLVILAGIGYWLRHWKYIEIVCSVPSVFFLLYWWLIPESARWLVSQGRYKEANAIVQKAAKVNRVNISENAIDEKSVLDTKTGRVWELFTHKVLLIRTLIIFFNWMVVSMVYYGLSLNSGNLGGNYYLNFFLSGLVEFPAYTLCLVFLERTGRKFLHASCMILGGLFCISTIFTILYADQSLQPVTVTLAMLGKLGIAAAFAVIYVWSAELYPTVVRNQGMGASSSCARIGGMMAPYIADLSKIIDGDIGRALPLVIFGGFSVLAGLLSLMLPETRNRHLPEFIQDGIDFGKAAPPDTKNGDVKNGSQYVYTNKTFDDITFDVPAEKTKNIDVKL